MNIEVVSIGNEILRGTTVNTNAAEIGQALFKEGYRVSRQTSLPDDPKLLKKGLKEALERSQLVITTGGLGPTCDDLTRRAAAELFDSELHYDAIIAEDLKRRYGDLLISLEDQATVPTKAVLFNNPVGTAAGLVFHTVQNTLILMPGIPREMRVMLAEQLIPYLKSHFPQPQKFFSRVLHFFQLSESSVDPLLRELQQRYPSIEFGIYPAHGTLSIYATVLSNDDIAGERELAPAMEAISTRFAENIFESPSGAIEEAVQKLFIKNGWTLSTAESCTGGSVAAHLTRIPGASNYFLGSIVSYSNQLKQSLLGVPEELLKSKGAVSEEVAVAMARGALEVMQSEFSLAVSGIAGPTGGTAEKPVGTIWAVIVQKGRAPCAWRFQAKGSREMTIAWSVNAVLGKLLTYAREK